MVWLTLALVVYGIGTTVILMRETLRLNRKPSYLTRLASVARQDLPAKDQLWYELERSKLEQQDTPWYQRLLSTIGVVAFATMAITAGLQTMQIRSQADQLARIEKDAEHVRSRQEFLLARMSEAILADYQRTGSVADADTEFLQARLAVLGKKAEPTRDEMREAMNLALALGDGRAVISWIEKNPTVLEGATLPDKLAAGEYYFGMHNRQKAAALVKDIEQYESFLISDDYRLRFVALRYELFPDSRNEAVADIARIMRCSRGEAEAKLDELGENLNTMVLHFRD